MLLSQHKSITAMYTTACTIERGDEQIDLDVEYALTRYYPARTYGPAEDCYPAEGGEIDDFTAYVDGKPIDLTPAEQRIVERHIYETHYY